MTYEITFYFSTNHIIEADNEQEARMYAEREAEENLRQNCWGYIDETEVRGI